MFCAINAQLSPLWINTQRKNQSMRNASAQGYPGRTAGVARDRRRAVVKHTHQLALSAHTRWRGTAVLARTRVNAY